MVTTHRIGHFDVEAHRHDGTDECALKLAEWVRSQGGKVDVIPKGQFEPDVHFAFLRLHDRYDRLVQPNFWIVKTDDNQFYTVYPAIFTNMYVAVEETVNA